MTPPSPLHLGSTRHPPVLALLTLVWLLGACAPTALPAATMRLDPALADVDAQPVFGRQGWQPGQILRFGPYLTEPVTRSWTLSYDIPFIVRFQGAQQKVGFRQLDAGGRWADVFLVDTLHDDELPLARDLFLTVLDETSLVGNVVLPDGTWDLLVYAPEDSLAPRSATGFIRRDDVVIDLRQVRAYSGSALPPDAPLGYEFVREGRVVGAVELIGDGRVWLASALDDTTRLVLASAASSLLLRQDLREAL